MIAFMGVLNSWLTLATNSLFIRAASSAVSFAFRRTRSVSLCDGYVPQNELVAHAAAELEGCREDAHRYRGAVPGDYFTFGRLRALEDAPGEILRCEGLGPSGQNPPRIHRQELVSRTGRSGAPPACCSR